MNLNVPSPFLSLIILMAVVVLSANVVARAETYYIDYANGDDAKKGTTPETAWKRAPGDPEAAANAAAAKLKPGDVVQFRGGVVYPGSIVIPASGAEGKPIVYKGKGWGDGRAVVEGSERVTGWKKCASPADAGGSANFANLFYAEITADSPFLLNLHEVDPKSGQDDFLWIAQDPNPADPFFNDRRDSFYPVERADLTTTTITSAKAFKSDDPNHFDGASILIWLNPNFTRRFAITAYDPKTKTVTFPDVGAKGLYDDNRTQYFAIQNSVHAIDGPGEYAVPAPGADGKRRVVLWPRSTVDLDKRISRSVREIGFLLDDKSHITIEGFEIRKFAGESDAGGCGIRTGGRGAGKKGNYVLRDNLIHHNMSGGKGHGGIYLDQTANAVVEDNEVLWNNNHRAIFVTSGDNIIIRNNRVEHAGRTAVVMYGGKNSQILNNRISHIYGTHANALTLYIACENVLVAGNVITDASNAVTFQDSGPLYFINNVTDGGGEFKNVSEWPNTTRGPWASGEIVFINNTFVNAGSDSALNLGQDPKKKYTVINNVLDGLGIKQSKGETPSITHAHNLYTGMNSFQSEKYGWKLGDGEAKADDKALLVDPAKGKYQLKAGSPAIKAGKDVSDLLPRKAFPNVDFDALLGTTKGNIGAAPAD